MRKEKEIRSLGRLGLGSGSENLGRDTRLVLLECFLKPGGKGGDGQSGNMVRGVKARVVHSTELVDLGVESILRGPSTRRVEDL